MQQAGRNRGTGKPIIASALRAREIGRDPSPRKALWPAADVRRINRSYDGGASGLRCGPSQTGGSLDVADNRRPYTCRCGL